jgi:hypothetical protein
MKSLEGRITVDFQESYFRRIPGFMRLTDVTFIHPRTRRAASVTEHRPS